MHLTRAFGAMVHRPVFDTFRGKGFAEDVRVGVQPGVEERETHEQRYGHGARQRERQMVENEAAT